MERIKNFLFKNSTTRQTIVKNTFWIGASTTLIKIVRAVIIIYAARLLGTESYGVFTYAMSIVAIFAVVSDMGISSILIRELSKRSEHMKEYFSSALVIKVGLLFVMMALVVGIAPFVSHFDTATPLLWIIGLSILFESLRGFVYSIPRAQNRMQSEAGISVVNEFLCTVLIVGLFLRNPSPSSLALSFMIGNGIGLFISLVSVRRYIVGITRHINWSLIVPLIKMMLPFAILGVFGIFMTNIDAVIIGMFGDAHMLGLYGAAQRPLNILYILPNFLTISLLPLMSKFIQEGRKETVTNLIQTSSRIGITIALPLVLGGILVAGPLINVLFGYDYIGAVLTFQILLTTLLFVFPGTIYADVLLAQNNQKFFLVSSTVSALINVILDVILIPRYGIAGSAIATVAAQIAANTLFYLRVRKTYNVHPLRGLLKPFSATVLMSVTVYLLIALHFPLIPTILLSGALYAALLFVMKDKSIIELQRSFRRA